MLDAHHGLHHDHARHVQQQEEHDDGHVQGHVAHAQRRDGPAQQLDWRVGHDEQRLGHEHEPAQRAEAAGEGRNRLNDNTDNENPRVEPNQGVQNYSTIIHPARLT